MRVLLAVVLLAACTGGAAVPPGAVHADSTESAGAVFHGSFVWRSDRRGFGEFSGLHMPDGRRFVTVTDTGSIGHGVLERDRDGRIAAVRLDTLARLVNAEGAPLRGEQADAESVTIGADGRIYVAFERNHRVLVYPPDGGAATALPTHRDFANLRNNLGIEAMAMDRSGVLYATPEMPPRGWSGPDHPVYRFRDGQWDSALSIQRDSFFLPVGAAFGPDGLLYLLERNYLPGIGFRSRVRRFQVGEAAITGGAVVFESPRGRYGNLEGLAVWRDQQGDLMLTMISDDNRSPAMPTQWVEYRLTR